MAEAKLNSVAAKRPAGPPPGPKRVGHQIIFYCPNGDRIVVPAAFGGKTGLCTKCKVQVLIPALEPESEPPPAGPAATSPDPATTGLMPPEPVAEPGTPPVDWDMFAGQSVATVMPDVMPELADLDRGSADDTSPAIMPGADHHPAARLVARLWQERAHGGIIELHLAGGSVILPEWYEVDWSRGTHGLFASQAADGTVTMTAIAWDTLEKIVVRQVRDLPQGFE